MSGYYNAFIFYRGVEYFDQHSGAAQVKHWSKYLHIFGVRKQEKAGKSSKISQKICFLFYTTMLVKGFYSQKKVLKRNGENLNETLSPSNHVLLYYQGESTIFDTGIY